jgi:hypothetical protein
MDLRSAQKWVQERFLRMNRFQIPWGLVLRHGDRKLGDQKLRKMGQKLMGVKKRETDRGLEQVWPLVLPLV